MTRVNIFSCKGKYCGFEISGHSGAGREGNDIVCAAISSCAYMVANTVTDVMGISANARVDDGFMKFEPDIQRMDDYFHLLAGFVLHVTELEKDYSKNLKVTFTEV